MIAALTLEDHLPKFSIHDHNGNELSDLDLFGSVAMMIFYHSNKTFFGKQLASFLQNHMEELEKQHNVIVLAVSTDSAEEHEHFLLKHEIDSVMLCDEDLMLSRSFGVIDADGNIQSSIFIFDQDGDIVYVNLHPNFEQLPNNIMQVLAKINNRCQY